MRPGMACLLDLLRGRDQCCAADDLEWDAMLALAEEEHVLPWAADLLRGQRDSMSPERAMRVQAIEREAAIAGFYWSCELKCLMAALAQQKIDVVPLKGPFLAQRLYGCAALRGCRDLDLLVGAADFERTEMVLLDLGFAPGVADDYHRAWTRRGATVELHYDVENPLAYDFAVAGALLGTHAATFEEEICRQLAPEDELLFLCLHAARHRYERLSLIVDLQLGFEKLAVNAGGWRPRDEVRELNGLLALGLAMVARLEPGFEAKCEIGVSAQYRSHLERVADGLWDGLMNRASGRLDWRAVHAFFMEIEQPGWARVRRWGRHMRILAGRVIEPDSEFAAKFGLHHAWHARILRPLRLISETIGGRSSHGG